MINIWIASVCEEYNAKYLFQALESISRLDKEFKLVLSIFSESKGVIISADEVLNRLGGKIVVRDKKLMQFEHYELLINEENLHPEDWIIFLDDDDLLLNNSLNFLDENSDGYVGLQYVGVDLNKDILPDEEKQSIDSVYKFISKNKNNITVADDFSGSAIRTKYLRKYFEMNVERLPYIEDTKLMNFIEILPKHKVLTEPIVYHRIKENPSTWVNGFLSYLKDLIPK